MLNDTIYQIKLNDPTKWEFCGKQNPECENLYRASNLASPKNQLRKIEETSLPHTVWTSWRYVLKKANIKT